MILMPLVATALTSTAANSPSSAACVSARFGRRSRWYAANTPLQGGTHQGFVCAECIRFKPFKRIRFKPVEPGPASDLCGDRLAEQSCWDTPGHQKRDDWDGLRRHGVSDQGV